MPISEGALLLPAVSLRPSRGPHVSPRLLPLCLLDFSFKARAPAEVESKNVKDEGKVGCGERGLESDVLGFVKFFAFFLVLLSKIFFLFIYFFYLKLFTVALGS